MAAGAPAAPPPRGVCGLHARGGGARALCAAGEDERGEASLFYAATLCLNARNRCGAGEGGERGEGGRRVRLRAAQAARKLLERTRGLRRDARPWRDFGAFCARGDKHTNESRRRAGSGSAVRPEGTQRAAFVAWKRARDSSRAGVGAARTPLCHH